jgi:hypothetical protein
MSPTAHKPTACDECLAPCGGSYPVASRNNFFRGCPLLTPGSPGRLADINLWIYSLIISKFFLALKTVNLLLVIELNHLYFTTKRKRNNNKRNFFRHHIFEGCPGIPWLPLRDATDRTPPLLNFAVFYMTICLS